MNLKHCFALGIVFAIADCFASGIVFAIAVAPHIAEAQAPRGESESRIVAPSDVRETEQFGGGGLGLGPSPSFDFSRVNWGCVLCGVFCFGEIAFTGCLLTCLKPLRRRRRS